MTGIVQGVGFRPFVHRTATDLGLRGFVCNDTNGVSVEVEGPGIAVETFLERLEAQPPTLAEVRSVMVTELEVSDATAPFRIAETVPGVETSALVAPDVGPCEECLAEFADAGARRHRYAFTNCTNCGPRFTIVASVPYDRSNTTMAGFEMCERCREEFSDPSDRRFHAQPLCCPECGPQLSFITPDGAPIAHDPIGGLVRAIDDGLVVAVKGVGGFQLAVDAGSDVAVARLRERKRRDGKPLALLVRDIAMAKSLCLVTPAEETLLTSPERPIVLLRRRTTPIMRVSDLVAPDNGWLGVMLPPSPTHVLIAEAVVRPLVLTSGNRSEEPMVHRDEDVASRLRGIADAVLTHDREIEVPVDDSVIRVVGGRPLPMRRARGYAPRPIRLPWSLRRPVLGCGAHLKNTVCLARSSDAFVSQHLGDLSNPIIVEQFRRTIDHYTDLFDIRPELVAHDLHPDYLSTAYAMELDGVERVAVQHHHAHIASCLVDNQTNEPVIGLAFDGLGLGDDGTAWGGEVLVADLLGHERIGHLRQVPMPGGDRATKEPWRMAASHLYVADPDVGRGHSSVAQRNADRWTPVTDLARTGLHAPITSSMGRLFDAVAAIVGDRDVITYEGQAAIELEQSIDPTCVDSYPVDIIDGAPFEVDGSTLVARIAADMDRGHPPAVLAARFHNWVVDMSADCADRVRALHGIDIVALSGGVFQNALLVERLIGALEHRGFRVLTHRTVPPNDGGISLGQVAVAGATDLVR